MSSLLAEEPHVWWLSGELTFTTVGALLAEFTTQRASRPDPQIVDLSKVDRTDSAGLALLIEMLKQTRAAPITFHNIPDQMLALATVSGVQDLLMGTSSHQ